MQRFYPCGGVNRRHFLAACACVPVVSPALSGSSILAQEAREQASVKATHAGVKAGGEGNLRSARALPRPGDRGQESGDDPPGLQEPARQSRRHSKRG